MNIKISPQIVFVLVVLLLILSVSIYDNFNRVVVSEKSIELGITDISPKGSGGGVIVPASCPSFAHSPGQCTPPDFSGISSSNTDAFSSFNSGEGSGGGVSGATASSGQNNIIINEGGSVVLPWSCKNSSSSSGVNFSTGDAVSGSVFVNPLEDTTYTVVCSNGGQSSVEVIVLHPELEITADPTQVRSGRESLITWSATVVDSCNVTGTNGFSATGLSGSQPSNPITLQSIFTLTCENVAGTLSKNVTVYLIPEFFEF